MELKVANVVMDWFQLNKLYYSGSLLYNFVFCSIGKQEEVDATIETLKVVKGPFSHWARVMVDVCAYAGKNKNLI